MIKQSIQNLGIVQLNEMQNAAIESIQSNEDLLLLSPTGSGKTLAFLLPLLEKLDPNKVYIQALIMVPSRELALQIEQVFKSMKTGLKVNCCYGGHSVRIEQNNLSESPAVLIGTPGRLADLIRRGTFKPAGIEYLVLDEFDKSLEFGFQKDMTFIVSQMLMLKQRILTSASHSIAIPEFVGINNPKELNYLTKEENTSLTLKLITTKEAEKLETLFALICQLGLKTTLIFCNHRDAVERISQTLKQRGIYHGTFHGGLEQEERERSLVKFRNGSHRILICTDLASRGLDIPEIGQVIHYQLPKKEDAFIHRNGRTARMHATGSSYLLIADNEERPEYIPENTEVTTIQEEIRIPELPIWTTLYIGAGKKDKINKIDIVGHLLKTGGLQKDELGLIEVKDHFAYASVNRTKVKSLLKKIQGVKIKRKKIKIEQAR